MIAFPSGWIILLLAVSSGWWLPLALRPIAYALIMWPSKEESSMKRCTRLDCNGDYYTDEHGNRIVCRDRLIKVLDKIRKRDAELLKRLAR